MHRLGLAIVMVAACGGAANKPAPAQPVSNQSPETAHRPAIEAAQNAGGDLGSGETDVYDGVLGADDMNGGFGYGASGYGAGGGGTGWGTIGTGTYGTIGHGAGTGTGVPTVRIGSPSATGDLDKAIIRRYIKLNLQEITYCYEKALIAAPQLAGTVQASFVIAADGTVTVSTATGVDADVAACIAGVVQQIVFPAPKGGGVVNVNYPFTFKPASN